MNTTIGALWSDLYTNSASHFRCAHACRFEQDGDMLSSKWSHVKSGLSMTDLCLQMMHEVVC